MKKQVKLGWEPHKYRKSHTKHLNREPGYTGWLLVWVNRRRVEEEGSKCTAAQPIVLKKELCSALYTLYKFSWKL